MVECLSGLSSRPEAAGTVFNVGGRDEIPIRELAERIKRLTDSRSEIVHVPYEEAYGDDFEDLRRRVPDISRVERLPGWQPRRSLDEALSAIIERERESEPTQRPGASEPPSPAAGAPLTQV